MKQLKNIIHWIKLPSRMQRTACLEFPDYLKEKTEQSIGRELSQQEYIEVCLALKQFFGAYVLSYHSKVAMPSFAADMLWHEIILNTKYYNKLCAESLGHFMHHLTNEAKTGEQSDNTDLKRVWSYCCAIEGIDALNPKKLPALFSIDRQLALTHRGYFWFLTIKDRDLFLADPVNSVVKNTPCIEEMLGPWKMHS